MRGNKGIACLMTATVALTGLGCMSGCGAQIIEPSRPAEATEPTLGPARAQDDYYRFINEDSIVNAEFEYGEQSAGEAFDSHMVQDQVEGIITDCVNGSGYTPGSEEYVIQNAYNCFMAYDFESGEVPEQLDQILHEIDGISSIEEYLLMDAGLEKILEFREDLIQIRSQLDLRASPLLYQLQPESAKILKLHESNVIQCHESGVVHQYNGFSN